LGKIRILIADDHPVLRQGLAALMANESDLELVGEAADGREAISQYRLLRPDITLLDVRMPLLDGIEVTRAIRAEFPGASIIVLTTFSGDVSAHRALSAGAQAYVLKGMLRKELLDTIRAVARGQKRVAPSIAAEIAKHSGDESLSAREIEVLKLAAVGNANKRIAMHLSITEETVKGHMRTILAKLNANDRTHAVTLGITRGIIQVDDQ
jgi:DNA-binding NarL/FixJ family response regulator